MAKIKMKFEFKNPKELFLMYINNCLYFFVGFLSQTIQYLTIGTCKITVEPRECDKYNSCYHFGAGMAFGLGMLFCAFGFMVFSCELLEWIMP